MQPFHNVESQIPKEIMPTPGTFILRKEGKPRNPKYSVVMYTSGMDNGQATYINVFYHFNVKGNATLLGENSVPVLTDFFDDENISRYYISNETLYKIIDLFFQNTVTYPNSALALTRTVETLRDAGKADEFEIQRLIEVLEPELRD